VLFRSTSTSLTLRALLKTASGRLGLGVPGRSVSGLTAAAKAWFAAAAAANQAFAAAVSPLTDRPGTPRPRRPEAVLSSARSVREVEVDDELMIEIRRSTGTFNYRTAVRA